MSAMNRNGSGETESERVCSPFAKPLFLWLLLLIYYSISINVRLEVCIMKLNLSVLTCISYCVCCDVIVLLLAWITSSKRTPDAICCAIHTVLHQAVAGLNEEELLEGCFLFCSGSLVLVLYQALSFARSFTPAHCIFPSLGNDKGK